jgi:propanol-preferring alcohol dehydrogenase
MQSTMKAAVVREFGKPLVIEEVQVPRPGPGQILVKIAATGVCHTDLHAAEGDWPVKPNPPFIPGHEGAGHVVAVGQGVTHVKEGDRVGVPWLYSACGHCVHCLGGWETLCHEQQNTGYSVNGSFAEYVLADANYVGLLPDNVSFIDVSPVLCAGVTVYKGLKVTDTKPGDWVAISGIGGLGHMAVQYAKAMGLNVVAVDIDDAKLKLAQDLGASLTVNARDVDPVAFITKEIGGAQGVLVTAVSPKAFQQAMGMARQSVKPVVCGCSMRDRAMADIEPETMKRADIAEAIYRKVGMSRAESLLLVEAIMAQISGALGRGENVKIAGFGTFKLNDKGERIGRNPRTGEAAMVSARRVVTFRPSETLRDRVAGL